MNNVRGSVALVHDHKFFKDEARIYSAGTFPYSVLARYVNSFGSVHVIGRASDAAPKGSLAVSSGNGVTFNLLGNVKSLKGIGGIFSVYYAIRRDTASSDLVIVRLPSLFGLLAIFANRQRLDRVVVEVVGNLGEKDMFESWPARAYGLAMHWATRHAIYKARNVIYITRAYLQSVYPTSGRSFVCPNVKIPAIHPSTLEARCKQWTQRSAAGQLRIGLVGSLDVSYKGHKVAIQVLSYILKASPNLDVTLHFLGPGDRRSLAGYAERLGVSSRVIFEGVRSSGLAVFQWMDSIDFLLQPSTSEAQGRALLEGLSRGLPVVASNVGGIPEFLPASNVFDPYDVPGLAQWVVARAASFETYVAEVTMSLDIASKYQETVVEESRRQVFSELSRLYAEGC